MQIEDETQKNKTLGTLIAIPAVLVGYGPTFLPYLAGSEDAMIIAMLWCVFMGPFLGPGLVLMACDHMLGDKSYDVIYPPWFELITKLTGKAFLGLLVFAGLIYLLSPMRY